MGSESYSLGFLGIGELASAGVVDTAVGSRMGFQGGDKFALGSASFAVDVVGGGGGGGLSPGSAYQRNEREGGREGR